MECETEHLVEILKQWSERGLSICRPLTTGMMSCPTCGLAST